MTLTDLAPIPSALDVDDLRLEVRGPVLAAGDDGLAAEVATWNTAITHTPAVAVGAVCAADVAAAVRFATAHGLPSPSRPPATARCATPTARCW
jgi:hypothetical protein